MSFLVVLLAAAVVALIVIILRFQKEIQTVRLRLALAGPYLIRSGAPLQEIGPLLFPAQWRVIAQGGNNNPGRMGGLELCPCQSEYTVATNQAVINAWPNPAQVAACAANPPAARGPLWTCNEDCIQVMTHLWHGWMVVQDVQTGQMKFNCHTFAQYHCKKPNDPEREKPPEPNPPPPPPPDVQG